MLSVLDCVTQEHDLWLVLLAAIICSAGSWATIQLFARVRMAIAGERVAWLVMAAVVSGAMIWCTHFVAVLGFDPGLPVGFDPVLTIWSLLVGIVGTAIGLLMAVTLRHRLAPALGGSIVGLAITSMHYTGMLAYRVQGIVSWDYGYLVASIVLSVAFGAASLFAATDERFSGRRYIAALLLILAVVTLHFTGMTAFRVEPMLVEGSFSNPAALRAMAIAVAAIAIVVLGAGWASSLIDTRARAEASDALNNMSNGLVMIAGDGTIQLFNRRLMELFRLGRSEISVGMSLSDYLYNVGAKVGWDADRTQRVIENHGKWMADDQTMRVDHHFADGTVLNIACQPVKGGGAIITYDDVTEARENQEKVTHMAFHDALTGLPNRRRFLDEIAGLATTSDYAMLMVDLDRFKFVNDTLGHAVGDMLLVAVAQRLNSVCEGAGTVYRLGGDELGVLAMCDTDEVLELAGGLVNALSQPFQIGEGTTSIGCSIGIAFAKVGDDPELVQQMADLALYKAKENGRGRMQVYEEGMLEHASKQRQVERDLEEALKSGQFELHYQPLFDLPDRRLTGFEALIRWHHPERGMVSPADFIPIAEQTGAILDIGAWVIEQACWQLSQWPDDIYISINVSPVQLRSPNILQQLVQALDRHGLTPRRIEIELTETAMADKSEQIAAALTGLRALGVRIAMDDFGTGYSSLAHLREFELDRIKIDQSFINVSPTDSGAAAVVRAVTGLARELAISTTGEGVESEEQLAKLEALGCSAAQGYFLGRPINAKAATSLLDETLLSNAMKLERMKKSNLRLAALTA